MITVTVHNQGVLDRLNRLGARLHDLSPAMAGIGQELRTRILARRETRREPNGQPWAPWQPATVASYPKDGNRRLLDRYGDMFNSLSYEADATSVRVGFAQDYAVHHEFGTRHMARRGLLFDDASAGLLAAADEQAVLDTINDYLLA